MKVIRTGFVLLILTISIYSVSASGYDYSNFLGEDWYGIYMQGNKIGYGFIELRRDSEKHWVANVEMSFSFTMNQMQTGISFSETRIYDGANDELIYNKFINKNDFGNITVEGELKGDIYNVIIDVAGQKSSLSLIPPVEKLSDELKIEIMAADGKLKVGDQLEINTFEAQPPLTGSLKHIMKVTDQKQMIFSGVATDVFVISDSLPEFGLKMLTIVDNNGNILHQELGSMNLVIKSEPEETAKKLDTPFDILANNVISAPDGPNNPRSTTQASYVISGYDISLLPDSDRMTITMFSPDSANISIVKDLTDNFNLAIPIIDEDYKSFLKPEHLIQSDNQAIINLAKEIIKTETNAFKAAVLINDWVFKNIRKEFSPDISNALQTYRSGKGDCGEHAALTVALLRASGIPSRIASGLAYWPEGEGFAFHAWTEVYVGKWIQMDPTWGETIADAAHIMLANSSFEAQLASLINAMGGLKITFLSYD